MLQVVLFSPHIVNTMYCYFSVSNCIRKIYQLPFCPPDSIIRKQCCKKSRHRLPDIWMQNRLIKMQVKLNENIKWIPELNFNLRHSYSHFIWLQMNQDTSWGTTGFWPHNDTITELQQLFQSSTVPFSWNK